MSWSLNRLSHLGPPKVHSSLPKELSNKFSYILEPGRKFKSFSKTTCFLLLTSEKHALLLSLYHIDMSASEACFGFQSSLYCTKSSKIVSYAPIFDFSHILNAFVTFYL